MLVISKSAFSCADKMTVGQYINQGDLEQVKKAVACGFDLHAERDKALHIAVRKQQPAVEKYFRSLGLKDNAYFIETLWLRDYYQLIALDRALNLYKLDNFKYPEAKNWHQALAKYKGDATNFEDMWQRNYIYQPKNNENRFILCSYGRDGKQGGARYDRDICSSDDIDSLKAELKKIGYR